MAALTVFLLVCGNSVSAVVLILIVWVVVEPARRLLRVVRRTARLCQARRDPGEGSRRHDDGRRRHVPVQAGSERQQHPHRPHPAAAGGVGRGYGRVHRLREAGYLPNGMEPDSQKECQEYTDLLQSLGGVDLQLLGIGHNGHIGFNEPGEAFDKQVHCVNLTQSTIEANKRFFASADDVPKQAYTMGIKTIMQAKKILIVASGEDKAEIVRDAFFGPITPKVPASVLQLHNDVTLVADEAALSKLPL